MAVANFGAAFGGLHAGTDAAVQSRQLVGQSDRPIYSASVETLTPPSGGRDVTDSTARIQEAIDVAHRAGGGLVTMAPGEYYINGPVVLRSNTWLVGSGPSASVRIGPGGEIGTAAKDGVEGTGLARIKIVNTNSSRPVNRPALIVRSCAYSVFRDLTFEGWENQTVALIAPDNASGPIRNCIFNHFENWDVKGCYRGIWYRGLDDESKGNRFGKGLAVTSNNTWINITLRYVRENGIHAERWADTELYLKLYVQLTADNATAINLNTHPTQPWQIDRFCFVMPCLVYSANRKVTAVTNPSTLTAIRLGPGTRGCSGWHVESDKAWNRTSLRGRVDPSIDHFLVDEGGNFYFFYVSHCGRGGRIGPRIYTKNFDRIDLGALVIHSDGRVDVKGALRSQKTFSIPVVDTGAVPTAAVAGRGAMVGVQTRSGGIELRLSDGKSWTRFREK